MDYIIDDTSEDDFVVQSLINFTYDNRNRLIEEERTGGHPYHLKYAYDKAGNRMSKYDVLSGRATLYTYDVQAPTQYGSQGNRLMREATYEYDGSANWVPGPPLAERNYVYDGLGRVFYVLENDPATATYTGTQLSYNTQGLVWLATRSSWQLDGANEPVNIQYLSAMEYRYDSARGRYRVQRRDPRQKIGGAPNPTYLYPWDGSAVSPNEGTWSDYDSDDVHGDFTLAVSAGAADLTNTMAHAPGLAQSPWNGAQPPSAAGTAYLHGNLIGTNERMTRGTGYPPPVVHRAVYTAFGERVYADGGHQGLPPENSRYGYAGAWGYQGSPYSSGDPLADLGWLHVGHRYYDPSSGRFVQRDPIGIGGGPNVYDYVGGNPVAEIDPLGLINWSKIRIYIGAGAAAIGVPAAILGIEIYIHIKAEDAANDAAKGAGAIRGVQTCIGEMNETLILGKTYSVPKSLRNAKFKCLFFILLHDGRISITGEFDGQPFQFYPNAKWREWQLDPRPAP